MLVRLLVVLTFLGQPPPRACTCAAEATGVPDAARSVQADAPAASRCGHSGAAQRGTVTPHHAPHHHSPECPGCHSEPVDAVSQPVGVVLDSADPSTPSFAPAPGADPVPTYELVATAAPVPHVPLFITFRVLRN